MIDVVPELRELGHDGVQARREEERLAYLDFLASGGGSKYVHNEDDAMHERRCVYLRECMNQAGLGGDVPVPKHRFVPNQIECLVEKDEAENDVIVFGCETSEADLIETLVRMHGV